MSLGSVTAQTVDLAGTYGDNKGALAPTTLHAHLYEGDPTGSGVEVVGTGYAALAVANTDAALGATPTDGQLGPITLDFGTAGADDWGTPDYWGFTDGTGNLYDYQEIANPAEIATGDPVTLTVTIGAV